MRAYHVDRFNKLSAGMTICLQDIYVEPAILKTILDKRYPNGLSLHGDKYYGQPASKETLQDILTENIYEYERKLYFPDRPSRLQSFFASETIEGAMFWVSRIGVKNYTIWEIEFPDDRFVKLDAAWLGVNKDDLSFLVAAYFAEKYWSGEASENPQWELLIQTPVKIISSVKTY
ncbi:hypothetical protein D3C74_216220 [compost metagenome]